MAKVETVMVQHKDGYAVINASDFDEKKHKVYTAPKSPAPKAPAAK